MVNRFFLDTNTPSFVPNHVGQRKMHVCACPYAGPGRGRGGVAVCHVVYAITNYMYIYTRYTWGVVRVGFRPIPQKQTNSRDWDGKVGLCCTSKFCQNAHMAVCFAAVICTIWMMILILHLAAVICVQRGDCLACSLVSVLFSRNCSRFEWESSSSSIERVRFSYVW